jgi:hypothetical protein
MLDDVSQSLMARFPAVACLAGTCNFELGANQDLTVLAAVISKVTFKASTHVGKSSFTSTTYFTKLRLINPNYPF